jgi:hypothetical protein
MLAIHAYLDQEIGPEPLPPRARSPTPARGGGWEAETHAGAFLQGALGDRLPRELTPNTSRQTVRMVQALSCPGN